MTKDTFTFVIHGGAGVISRNVDKKQYITALQEIIRKTYHFAMQDDSTALDIVEFAVKELEDEGLFNAGYGAVFTDSETHELEASIMNGQNLTCGATSLIKTIKNPISLARLVMEKTCHVYVVGEQAEKLAVESGLCQVTNAYYDTTKRRAQLAEAKLESIVCNDHDLDKGEGATGTVGCVCAKNGHVAAATSTGGMTNKMRGRVGDTPIIGAGTYANDETCAVSATGKGEEFLRHVAAYDVSARMELAGASLADAVRGTVHSKLPKESGGVIAVDRFGHHTIEFNCAGMFRGLGSLDAEGVRVGRVGIWEEWDEGQLDLSGV